MFGDILVNSTGVGTLGRIAYVKRLPEKKVTFDSHVKLIPADNTQILDEFLASVCWDINLMKLLQMVRQDKQN